MATLAKEIAEAAVIQSGRGSKIHGINGLETSFASAVNKKVSINAIIEGCLHLPTIEDDVTFGALYTNAPNDVAKNGLKAAWLQLPNISAAYNVSLSDIVTACEGSLSLGSAAALVDEYANKNNCGVVIFKMPSKDTDAKDLTCVSLKVSGEAVSLNVIIETVEASKVDYKKRIAALASAYRLIRKCSQGVKSLPELWAVAEKAVLDLKARGVSIDEIKERLDALFA